jgi:hypothetical protein
VSSLVLTRLDLALDFIVLRTGGSVVFGLTLRPGNGQARRTLGLQEGQGCLHVSGVRLSRWSPWRYSPVAPVEK